MYLCGMSKSTDEILASLLLPQGSDWRISFISTDEMEESIHVELEYAKPDVTVSGRHFPILDLRPPRQWRHLDLWQYKTYITARIPRYRLDGRVVSVPVPWADVGERLTDLLEKKR